MVTVSRTVMVLPERSLNTTSVSGADSRVPLILALSEHEARTSEMAAAMRRILQFFIFLED